METIEMMHNTLRDKCVAKHRLKSGKRGLKMVAYLLILTSVLADGNNTAYDKMR